MFAIRTNGTHRVREPSFLDLRPEARTEKIGEGISYLMVGVAIGFASYRRLVSQPLQRLQENGQGRRGDAISGQFIFCLGMRRLLRKETRERQSAQKLEFDRALS